MSTRGRRRHAVWSSLGITASIVGAISRPLVPVGARRIKPPHVRWRSEVTPSGLQLVPADGSTPLQFVCEPGRANPCPAVPRVHWSPDGSHISLHGGDRWAPGLFSIAALADRQMRPLDTGLEAPDIEGWLDPDTLLVSSRNDLFRVPISDPRAWLAYAPGTYARSDSRTTRFLPTCAFRGARTRRVRRRPRRRRLATGRSTTAVRPADVGDDLAIYQFQWAPTSDAIAFALTSELEVSAWPLGRRSRWNRTPPGLHLPDRTFEGASTFAWRPAWP